MPTYEVLPRFNTDLERLSLDRNAASTEPSPRSYRTCAEAGTLDWAVEKRASSRIPRGGQPLNPRVVTPLSRERGRVRLSLQGCAGCQG